MHHRDVTEILKVFEKRITKLEKRVVELEGEVEDLKAKEPRGVSGESAIETLANNMSIKTTEYNFSTGEKVTYTKADIIDLRQKVDESTSTGSSLGYSKFPPPVDSSMLEDGEVFEPWLHSSSMSSISPKSSLGAAKEQQSSAGTPSSTKSNRTGSRQQSRSQQQSQRKKVGDRPEFRERSKSESAVGAEENITISTKSEDNTIADLSEKKEMRFGLMVQFPSEEGDK